MNLKLTSDNELGNQKINLKKNTKTKRLATMKTSYNTSNNILPVFMVINIEEETDICIR